MWYGCNTFRHAVNDDQNSYERGRWSEHMETLVDAACVWGVRAYTLTYLHNVRWFKAIQQVHLQLKSCKLKLIYYMFAIVIVIYMITIILF